VTFIIGKNRRYPQGRIEVTMHSKGGRKDEKYMWPLEKFPLEWITR
jgi:hypothetical protein